MARFVTESHMRHHPSADETDAQQNHVKYLSSFLSVFIIEYCSGCSKYIQC